MAFPYVLSLWTHSFNDFTDNTHRFARILASILGTHEVFLVVDFSVFRQATAPGKRPSALGG